MVINWTKQALAELREYETNSKKTTDLEFRRRKKNHKNNGRTKQWK